MTGSSQTWKTIFRTVPIVCMLAFLAPSPGPGQESPEDPRKLLGEAVAHMVTGDQATALAKVEAALERCDETGDRHIRALGLFLRSMLTANTSGVDEVLATCSESLTTLEQLGDDFGSWMVRASRAEILRQLGRRDEALTTIQEALEQLERVERSGATISLDTIKIFVASQGLPSQMLEQAEAFLPLMQPLLLRMAKAATLMEMATIQRDRQEYEEALVSLEKALELSQPMGALDGQILNEMASIKRTLGREEEAAADEAKARESTTQQMTALVDPKLQQELLSLVMEGGALGSNQQTPLQDLEDRLARARSSGDVRSEAVLLHRMGWQYERERRHDDALFYYERSFETARRLKDRGREDEGSDPAGRRPAAELFAAIREDMEIEELLAAFAGASAQDLHDGLIFLAARQGQTAIAFTYAEKARVDEQNSGLATPARVEALELARVRTEVIDAETTLVAYYTAGPKLLAWVVDRAATQFAVLELPGDDLRRRAQSLTDAGSPDFDDQTADELYRKLIAPLRPHLRHRNLILVSHGVLRELPLDALWDAETRRFLAEDFTVTQAPSASSLSKNKS